MLDCSYSGSFIQVIEKMESDRETKFYSNGQLYVMVFTSSKEDEESYNLGPGKGSLFT